MPKFLLAAVVCLLAAAVVSAQEKTPEGSADRGYKIYMKLQCYTCHGTVGQGADRGTGPKLAPDPFPYYAFALQMRTPSQTMPAYREPFVSDQDLADMYAYLLSIKPSPPAKDIPLLNF